MTKESESVENGFPESPAETTANTYLLRKLRNELCPYLAATQLAESWWKLKLFKGYVFLADLLAAAAMYGLTQHYTSISKIGDVMSFAAPKAMEAFQWESLWGILSGSVLLITLFAKVYIQQDRLQDKIPLLENCIYQARRIKFKLRESLKQADPTTEITDAQRKMSDLIATCIEARAWPWDDLPNTDTLQSTLYERLVAGSRPDLWPKQDEFGRKI